MKLHAARRISGIALSVLSDTVKKSLKRKTSRRERVWNPATRKNRAGACSLVHSDDIDGKKSEDKRAERGWADGKSRKHALRSRHERFSVRKGSPGSRITCRSFKFSSRKNPGREKEGSLSSEKTSSRYPETVGHCLSDQSPLKRMRWLSCRWKRKIWRENNAWHAFARK